MLSLQEKKWFPFRISEIFLIYTGGDLIINKVKSGKIPIISHASSNNGICCRTKEIPKRKLFSHKNTISLADRGNFCAFIQDEDFYIGTRVKALEFKVSVTKNTMHFIAQQINQQSVKFCYGNNACDNLDNMIIMLPVNKNSEPDYEYMNKYVELKIEQLKKDYISYAKEQYNSLDINEIEPLSSKEWDEFYLTELFPEIKRGKRLTKKNQITGEYPYISSTSLNNGIDNYIKYDSKKMRMFENCLSIANSGSVGSSFFEPFKFIASDHVTHLKNNKYNKYIYLFIATMTNRLSEKYNFNREINDKRISREKIILPVDNEGKPDFNYMEKYIKFNMKQMYKDYLKTIEW